VRSRRWLFAALVAPVAACGSDDAGTEDSDVFQDLAGRVPATSLATPQATLQYVDMELVWQRLDVGADAAARLDSLGRTGEVETYSIPPRLFEDLAPRVDEARAEVGFDVTAIEQEIAVDQPPSELRIDRVAVERDDVVAAVEDDPVWSSDLETVEIDAGSYFDWSGGDEGQLDPSRRTPMRPLGTGGQLAVEPDGDTATVTRTERAADMEAALATAAGDAPSIAEEGPLAPAIEVLDDEPGAVLQAVGVVGALRVDRAILAGDDEATARLEELLAEQPAIEPYEGLLAVELIDGDADHAELLVVYGDDDAAAANVEAIEEHLTSGSSLRSALPLAELLPTESVQQDDAVVRVRFSDDVSFRNPVQAMFARDVLTIVD
jgi:hypothetical protein